MINMKKILTLLFSGLLLSSLCFAAEAPVAAKAPVAAPGDQAKIVENKKQEVTFCFKSKLISDSCPSDVFFRSNNFYVFCFK